MKKLTLILLVAMLAGCDWLRGGDKSGDSDAPLKVYSDVQERTPGGALIASKNGVSSEFKTAVDASLNEVFADSTALNYSNKLAFSDYVIYTLHDCTLSPVYQVQSFRLRADSYDGTVFDQDPRPGIGYILASEYVVLSGNVPTNSYVICYDAANVVANVRHGAEHIILWNNNQAEYERTKFHGNGEISHPIIPVRNLKK